MLNYCLSGLGFLFFILIAGEDTNHFLASISDLPLMLQFGLAALANLSILVALGYDCINRNNENTRTTAATLYGIGFLVFLMIISSERAFLTAAQTLPPVLQIGLVCVPLIALIASLISDFVGSRHRQTAKKEKASRKQNNSTTSKLLGITLCLILVVTLSACKEESIYRDTNKITETATMYNTTNAAAIEIIKLGGKVPKLENIIHFRDPRSNICFMHLFSDDGRGNYNTLGAAPVNCEMVEDLLINPAPPPPPPPVANCEQRSPEFEQTAPVPTQVSPEPMPPSQ